MIGRILVCSLMLVAVVTDRAAAEPAPARGDKVPPNKRAAAERFFRAGEQFFKQGQYQLAAESFEEAYKHLPLPAIAFSAAQAYRLQYFVDNERAGLDRAIELYEIYIREVPSGQRRDDAVVGLSELRVMRQALDASAGAGEGTAAAGAASTRMVVTTSIDGAQISVDGGSARGSPWVAAVEPGKHRIQVSAGGYVSFDETREVVAGQFLAVEVALDPEPARLAIRAEAGAQVAVGGRPVGVTPLAEPLVLSAGSHFVSIARRGRRAWSRQLELARGQSLEVDAELERTGQRTMALAGFGISGAVLVGAAVYGGLTYRADRDARSLRSQLRSDGLSGEELVEYRAAIDLRDSRRDVSLILLGTGAALAITSGLLFALDEPAFEAAPGGRPAAASSPDSPTVRVSPVVTPGGAGLAATARF